MYDSSIVAYVFSKISAFFGYLFDNLPVVINNLVDGLFVDSNGNFTVFFTALLSVLSIALSLAILRFLLNLIIGRFCI